MLSLHLTIEQNSLVVKDPMTMYTDNVKWNRKEREDSKIQNAE